MSDARLSGGARALLDAAKADGPSALAKAKIWSGVAAGAAAGAAGAGVTGAGVTGAGAATAAAAGSGKLVAMGALFGSALTVGLAVALLRIGPADAPRAPLTAPPAAALDGVGGPPPGAPVVNARAASPAASAPESPAPDKAGEPSGVAPSAAAHAPPAQTELAPRAAPRASRPAPPRASDDALTRESLLVAEARGALVREDARAALAATRAARAVSSHALEPEEMSLEARALRALGSAAEADAVDAQLRARYPDHALAR